MALNIPNKTAPCPTRHKLKLRSGDSTVSNNDGFNHLNKITGSKKRTFTEEQKVYKFLSKLGDCVCLAIYGGDSILNNYIPLDIKTAKNVLNKQLNEFEREIMPLLLREESMELFNIMELLSSIFKLTEKVSHATDASFKKTNEDNIRQSLRDEVHYLNVILFPPNFVTQLITSKYLNDYAIGFSIDARAEFGMY